VNAQVEEATGAAENRVHRLFEAAERNGGPYEICEQETFQALLREEGCKIGTIVNIPHGDKGYKTQCSSKPNGSSLHFFIFTPEPVDWQ